MPTRTTVPAARQEQDTGARRIELRADVPGEHDPRAVMSGSTQVGVVVQPVVDLLTGAVVGYEALSRLGPDPQEGPMPWLDRANQQGCAAAFQAVLLARSLEAMDALPLDAFLAVNVSPAVLGARTVQAVLRRAALERVVVELTEHDNVADLSALSREVQALRDRGARIALDDVGAGWSGLQQLAVLRPDIVKADRCLVQDIDRDPTRLELVRTLGTFASRIGATLLAEGVETEGELTASQAGGARWAQGYHLGRPSRGFDAVDPDLATRLAFRAGTAARHNVVAKLLDVDVVRLPMGASTVPAGTSARWAVTVHTDGTAHELRAVVDGQLVAAVGGCATAWIGEPMAQSLLRALARPACSRFEPLVAVDSRGLVMGVVAVDAMARALAADQV